LAPRRPPEITRFDICVLGALQHLMALLHLAEEVGRGRQQFEILPGQGTRLLGVQQRRMRLSPRQPATSIATPRELLVTTHRPSPPHRSQLHSRHPRHVSKP
jgi:hypothetical protein